MTYEETSLCKRQTDRFKGKGGSGGGNKAGTRGARGQGPFDDSWFALLYVHASQQLDGMGSQLIEPFQIGFQVPLKYEGVTYCK